MQGPVTAARKVYARPKLTGSDAIRLENFLLLLTCSWTWQWDLFDLIIAGKLPYKRQREPLRKALSDVGAYPPGGRHTAMVQCKGCQKPMPPQVVGNAGICLDCFYARLPLERMVQIPSSPCFDHRFSSSEFGGAMGDGYREIRKRVRKLQPVQGPISSYQHWVVQEEIESTDGEVEEAWYEVAGTPNAA